MIIGVPKEIKDNEYRVGIVPGGVEELTAAGHQVLIEKGAGQGSGISDAELGDAGAQIVASGEELFRRSEMILKVKEPQAAEFPLIRKGQVLFCYFHFAAEKALTQAILKTQSVAKVFRVYQVGLAGGSACPTSQFLVHDGGVFEVWSQGTAGEAWDYAGYYVVQRSI